MFHQFNISYPENLPDALQQSTEQFEADAKMAMAVKLFEMKKLSSGMAAQLAGVDRVYFLLNLHRYGVNMIDLDNQELESDLENAQLGQAKTKQASKLSSTSPVLAFPSC